jgi:hypothetical protein
MKLSLSTFSNSKDNYFNFKGNIREARRSLEYSKLYVNLTNQEIPDLLNKASEILDKIEFED